MIAMPRSAAGPGVGNLFLRLTKADNATGDGHHPEHTANGDPAGGRGEDAPEDNHHRGEDDSPFATEIITGQPANTLSVDAITD
jgi:hypothetical protein